MAIRPQEYSNWNVPSNLTERPAKNTHNNSMQQDMEVSTSPYSHHDMSGHPYVNHDASSYSSIQLEAGDMDLALPVIIDNSHYNHQEPYPLPSYTLLEPQPQGSMLDQGGNYTNTTYQDTNNYTEDDYIMFEDGAQILEAMESSSSMEQPLVSKDVPSGTRGKVSGRGRRRQPSLKNKRISESSDSSGQGGASSEYESSKTSADEACASPEDAAKKQGGQHKWVSRPLIKDCRICGSPATSVQHYGSISCYSCRAFFRRTVGSQREYLKCSRGDDSCTVDSVNRTNCKKCRYRKCIQVGMRPEKVDRVVRKREAMKTSDTTEDILEPPETMTEPKYRKIRERADKKCANTGQPDKTRTNKSKFNTQSIAEDDIGEAEEIPQPTTESQYDCNQTNTDVLKDETMDKFLSTNEEGNFGESSLETDQNLVELSADMISSMTSSWSDFQGTEQSPVTNNQFGIDLARLVNEVFQDDKKRSKTEKVPDMSSVKVNLWPKEAQKKYEENEEKVMSSSNIARTSFVDIKDNVTLDLGLTIEEEFKIYTLMAKRDHMFSTLWTVLRRMPRFMSIVTGFIASLTEGRRSCIVTEKILPISFLPGFEKLNLKQLTKFSKLFQFECVHNIDVKTRLKMIHFTLPAIEILTRGIIHGNRDKGTFLNQHRAAGTLNPVFEEILKQIEGLDEVKSFSPLNLDIFTSPWAVSQQDEDKFTNTLNEIGHVIGDDKKLGCLYFFLLLLSPITVNVSQVHPEFERIRSNLSLLTYRYIRSKTKNIEEANSTMDTLTRLIHDIHECADIHRNRRIFRPHEFPSFDNLMIAVEEELENAKIK